MFVLTSDGEHRGPRFQRIARHGITASTAPSMRKAHRARRAGYPGTQTRMVRRPVAGTLLLQETTIDRELYSSVVELHGRELDMALCCSARPNCWP